MKDAIERGLNVSDLEKHLTELMEDQEFANEYNALEEQYSFARQVIAARATHDCQRTQKRRATLDALSVP